MRGRLIAAALLGLLCGRGAGFGTAAPLPRLESSLQPNSVSLGEVATLTLTVEWEGGAEDLQILPPLPPSGRGFALEGSAQASAVVVRAGREEQQKRFSFQLRPTEAGVLRIPSSLVKYHRPPETEEFSLGGEELELTVTPAPSAGSAGWLIAVVVVLVGGAVVGGIRWRRRRRRVLAPPTATTPVLTPERVAEQGLELARRQRWAGEGAEASERIRTTLQQYRDSKLGEAGGTPLSAEALTGLEKLLEELEQYRFAAAGGDLADLDLLLRRAENILRRPSGPPRADRRTESKGEL